ncbi:hypothetical protein BH10PLA2_BH10PLA2_09750 [soil metagenome]
MISVTRPVWVIVACLVLTTAGCNRRLNFERSLTMGPGDVRSFSVEAPRVQQKVTITFSSSEVPVDVYVALEKDIEAASSALQNYKAPQGILASQMKARQGSVDVTIPARTAYGVIVAGSTKDTTVQVKMTGK